MPVGLECVHHRDRGALQVVPQRRLVQGRELELVDGLTHVGEPAVARLRD